MFFSVGSPGCRPGTVQCDWSWRAKRERNKSQQVFLLPLVNVCAVEMEGSGSDRIETQEARADEKDVKSEFDCVTKNCYVTYLEILSPLISLLFYCVDYILDFHLASCYYAGAQYLYYNETLQLVVCSTILIYAISIIMYVANEHKMALTKSVLERLPFQIIDVLINSLPLLRYIEILKYAWRTRKAQRDKDFKTQRECYELMAKENSEMALLTVFESFLETAPQLVLQITFILRRTEVVPTVTCHSHWIFFGVPILSMGGSIASYQKAKRLVQEHKENLTWKGTAMQFLWHSMVTASRILSISVALATFPAETIAACFVHWFIMAIWLSLGERTNFCSLERYSVVIQIVVDSLFCGILSFIYIFAFVTPKEGQKRTLYTYYYTIYFVENLLAAAAWATADTIMRNEWYFYPLFAGCIVPFIIGIVFMLLYYSHFHPTLPVIKCCDEPSDSGDESSDLGDVDLHTCSRDSAEDNSVTNKPSNETASEANEIVDEHKPAVESKC